MVNGLGSVKGEELFVLYGAVAGLDDAGLTIVEPEVGEFATSFEMAGVSLTMTWLDEDLEAAWRSPAYTPAYRKGAVDIRRECGVAADERRRAGPILSGGEHGSAAAAPVVLHVLAAISAVIDEVVRRPRSARRDRRRWRPRHRNATRSPGCGRTRTGGRRGRRGRGIRRAYAGDAWANRAGGRRAPCGVVPCGRSAKAWETPRPPRVTAVVAAAKAGIESVQRSGGAVVGDKTMVDALVPFGRRSKQAVADGASLADAWATRPRKQRGPPRTQSSLAAAQGPRPAAHGEEPRHARSGGSVLRHGDDRNRRRARGGTRQGRRLMTEELRIVIGSDEAGFDYKQVLLEDLRNDPRVASVIDVGVGESVATRRIRPWPSRRRR